MGTIEYSLARDHPAAEGHFPGNAIIPGAVLLSITLREIGEDLGASLYPCTIRAAKFYFPARPGDRMSIEFTGNVPGEIEFACAVHGKKVLAGQVECHGAATAR